MKENYNDISKFFSTSDLALTAVISLSQPVESIDKSNPSKAIFYFRRTTALENLLQEYWQRKLQIEPQQYFQQLKVIKARIYS